MKGTRFINRLSEKNYHLGKWVIVRPKIAHPHNSGSTGRIFLKFCTMKGANPYIKMILVIFQKNLGGQMDHFGSKNGASSQLWIGCENFCKFCTKKRANM